MNNVCYTQLYGEYDITILLLYIQRKDTMKLLDEEDTDFRDYGCYDSTVRNSIESNIARIGLTKAPSDFRKTAQIALCADRRQDKAMRPMASKS